MILGIEVAATLMGLYMLFTGKGVGKNAVAHVQYRILGALMVSLLPVAIVAVMGYGIMYAVQHPDIAPDKIGDEIHWPAVGIEFAVAVTYAIVGTVWDRSIRRKMGVLA